MNDKNFPRWLNTDRSYFAIGEYFKGNTVPTIPLTELLGLQAEEFKSYTKELLDFFKEERELIKLSDGIRTYSQFQDILAISVDGRNPLEYRHHCYYESLVYLRESAVSWLDGNILAALSLLRPFLESSILHLYWYLRGEKLNYDDFYNWLAGKKAKPPAKSQFDYVFSNLPCKDVVSQKQLERRRES